MNAILTGKEMHDALELIDTFCTLLRGNSRDAKLKYLCDIDHWDTCLLYTSPSPRD